MSYEYLIIGITSDEEKLYLSRIDNCYSRYRNFSDLTLPSLAKAREKAQIAVCLSQQQQIGTAKFLYLGDNNQRFHSADLPGSDPSPGKQWVGKQGADLTGFAATVAQRPLNRYLNHTTDGAPLKMVLCPLEYRNTDCFNKTGSSYFGNTGGTTFIGLRYKSTYQIITPSRTVLISESGANAYAEEYPAAYFRLNHRPGTYTWGLVRLDNSGINYRFVFGEGRYRSSSASKVANFNCTF